MRRPISRAGLEVVISRAVAAFGLLFGAQAVPVMLDQKSHIEPLWWWVMAGGIYGMLIACVIAAVLRWGVRIANTGLALAVVAALLLWIPGVGAQPWPIADRPWLWFMMTVATAAAAVAFPLWLAFAYLLVAPLLYGALRVTEYGGADPLGLVALDVLYAVLLGGAVLIIITMLRTAAAGVDAAQATALGRYAQAVHEHATEVERVQVDSIVHDGVLTAFLTASRAETSEEREQATLLARNAIRHLEEARATVPGDDTTVSVDELVERVIDSAGEAGAQFEIVCNRVEVGALPSLAAEALVAAARQAMVNSVQHAAAAGEAAPRRWVWVGPGLQSEVRVRVEVGDEGSGFDPGGIPAERLGVRVSIIERMLGAGGSAVVDSVPGRGTVVRLAWPTPAEPGRIEAEVERGGGPR